MYDDVPIPEQREGEMANKPIAQQLDYLALSGDKVSEDDIRRVTALYYGMNTYIDHEVGRLLTRLAEWKCVYYPGNHEGELYNLIDDPGELNNLWYEPKHTELKTKLTLRILDWCITTEDRRPKLG
jgi:hypothetical protein